MNAVAGVVVAGAAAGAAEVVVGVVVHLWEEESATHCLEAWVDLGLGGGGGLIGDLLAGGVGYLMGKNTSQNQPQYPAQYQQYQPQYQQATPQYQPPVPQYQPAQGSAGGVQDGRLAQLNLLGQMRAQGTLTDDEFQAEKQKIMNGY